MDIKAKQLNNGAVVVEISLSVPVKDWTDADKLIGEIGATTGTYQLENH